MGQLVIFPNKAFIVVKFKLYYISSQGARFGKAVLINKELAKDLGYFPNFQLCFILRLPAHFLEFWKDYRAHSFENIQTFQLSSSPSFARVGLNSV